MRKILVEYEKTALDDILNVVDWPKIDLREIFFNMGKICVEYGNTVYGIEYWIWLIDQKLSFVIFFQYGEICVEYENTTLDDILIIVDWRKNEFRTFFSILGKFSLHMKIAH